MTIAVLFNCIIVKDCVKVMNKSKKEKKCAIDTFSIDFNFKLTLDPSIDPKGIGGF